MKNHFIILFSLFFLVFNVGKSQETILCSSVGLELKIENTADVPTVTPNNDGTINLAFLQENITSIFESYNVYDFTQTYPDGSELLQKYYHISVNSRAIIEDITTQVSPSVMLIFDEDFYDVTLPINTPIESELIQFLDGNSFDVIKYRSTSDADGCSSCPLFDVPESFNFKVNFNYDSTEDILLVESSETTSCGNSFSIGLKGGNPNGYSNVNNMLQLWEYYSENASNVNSNEACSYIEGVIFDVFDISCSPYNMAIDNIFYFIDLDTETLRLTRSNLFFGEETIELSRNNLSINDDFLSQIKPYKSKDNPYLQIANLDNKVVLVEIFNTLGQPVRYTNHFKNNNINVSTLETGVYFIKISNSLNQEKVFKYIF